MNYRRITKIFNVIATILVVLFLLLALKNFYFNDNLLIHPDFFINYEGGFIRRGFDGNLLYLIANFFNIDFTFIVKMYSLITFLFFLFILIYLKFKRNIPLFILFSTSTLMLFFMYLDRGLRKDHIILLLIMLQSILVLNENIKTKTWSKLLFVFISLVGTLIHELFFIITFFPLLMVFWNNSEGSLKVFRKYLILILPSTILFFLLISVFPGNENQVSAIINSYQNVDYNVDYLRLLFTKSYYFWDQNYTWKQIVLFFVLLFSHGLFISTAVYPNLKNQKSKINFLVLLLLQMSVLILLSMMTIDYGRWIFFCFFTVIIFTFNNKNSQISTNQDFTTLDLIFKKLKYLPFILFFINTMPHSHWNGIDGIVKSNILLQLKNKLSAE